MKVRGCEAAGLGCQRVPVESLGATFQHKLPTSGVKVSQATELPRFPSLTYKVIYLTLLIKVLINTNVKVRKG